MAIVKKMFLAYYPFLIFLFILSLFFFRELGPQKEMFSYGDRNPFPSNFQMGWEKIKFSWDEQTPGISVAPGPIIFETFLTLASGNNGSVAQKINFILPLFLAFCSIYFVMGKLGIRSPWAKLIGGLIFAINPTAMGEIRGGAINTLYCTVFIPLIFWFLYQILWQEKNNLKNFLWLGVFSFLAFSFSDHIIIFIALFVFIFFLMKIFLGHEQGWLKKFIFSAFFLIIIVVVFNISYLFDYFNLATKAINSTGQNLAQKQMFADLFTSYAHIKPLEILRLGGGGFYEKMFGGKFWSLAGFIIPILFVLGLFKGFIRKEEKPVKYFLLLLFVAVLAFILAVHWRLLDWLFKFFPLLFRFRNTARLNLLLGFVFGVFTAGGIEWAIAKAKNSSSKLKYTIFIFIFLLLPIYLLSIKPILFGTILSGKNQQTQTLPDYYQKIFNYLKEDREKNGMARSFWFPWNQQVSRNISWQDPMPVGLLIGYGQYTTSNYVNIINQLYEFLAQNKNESAEKIFQLLDVKYIVVDRRAEPSDPEIKNGSVYLTPTLSGDPKKFEEIIKNFGNYQLIKGSDDFAVYVNPKIKNEEIKMFNDYDSFITYNPNNSLGILLDNKIDLSNAFELKTDKKFLENNDFYSLQSSPILVEEKFNQKTLDEKIWKADWNNQVLPAGKIILDADHQGIGLKTAIGPQQTIETNLQLDNTNNNEGNASIRVEDSGRYGFGLGFDFESGSSAPILHFHAKDNLGSWTKDLGRWDLEKHNYQFIRAENKIKLLIDNKEIINEDFNLDNELNFGIQNSRRQKITIDKFLVEDLNKNIVFAPKDKKDEKAQSINFSKKNEQNYIINNPAARYLALLRPFSSGWEAKIGHQTIKSFEINDWANGFDPGKTRGEVKIFYQPNKNRSLAILINFAIIIGACLYCAKKNNE